jgi:hypothetical protein
MGHISPISSPDTRDIERFANLENPWEILKVGWIS